MHYEEKLIDGHTHFRAKPDGEWLRKYATSEIITLSITEYEQLKKDAERYRWLRGWAGGKRLDVFKKSATKLQLDNAIDQAISEDKHNG